MHFYRRSAPRRYVIEVFDYTYIHFKCPRIRDTDPENKVSNRASPHPPNLCTHRYVWHYAALRWCRHPHSTPTHFYSGRLGGLLDRESRPVEHRSNYSSRHTGIAKRQRVVHGYLSSRPIAYLPFALSSHSSGWGNLVLSKCL